MYEIEIKDTRRVFEYTELSKSARINACDELAKLYVDTFDYMRESVDSAQHAADALDIDVHWPMCSTYEDMPYLRVRNDIYSVDSIDVDAISDGTWIGEGVKMAFMAHYDALKRAEMIVNRIDDMWRDAAYSAEQDELAFDYVHPVSFSAIDRMCSNVDNALDMLAPDIKNSVLRIRHEKKRAKHLECLYDRSFATFQKMYSRIAIQSLESGYNDLASEYSQYYDDDYYTEIFGPNGYMRDDMPLFDQFGNLSGYAMDTLPNDAKKCA